MGIVKSWCKRNEFDVILFLTSALRQCIIVAAHLAHSSIFLEIHTEPRDMTADCPRHPYIKRT